MASNPFLREAILQPRSKRTPIGEIARENRRVMEIYRDIKSVTVATREEVYSVVYIKLYQLLERCRASRGIRGERGDGSPSSLQLGGHDLSSLAYLIYFILGKEGGVWRTISEQALGVLRRGKGELGASM